MDRSSRDGLWIRSAVGRYERGLTLYATRLLDDPDGALDVVQETFCRLCRQPRQDIEDHLAQWLFAVCRNIALDVMRKDIRMKPLTDTRIETERAAGPSPSQIIEQRDCASAVLKAIGSLPARQQEVVRLKFQHGLSYRQISEVTKDSISNVGYLLHHALKSLREQMNVDPARPVRS